MHVLIKYSALMHQQLVQAVQVYGVSVVPFPDLSASLSSLCGHAATNV